MLKTITVNVTEKHIQAGRNNNSLISTGCPIAQAIKDILRPKYTCSVGRNEIHFYDAQFENGIIIVNLTARSKAFISKFDQRSTREKVKPFSFKIKVDEKYIRPKLLKPEA